jgi:DNA polymerase (family 10)
VSDAVAVTNDEVAEQFEAMADLLEANDVEYKPRAYRRAAENLRGHPGSVADLAVEDRDRLEAIDGVGESIADKVVEYVETGSIGELEELRDELPVDMAGLTRVEGVGPKTVGTLYEALGIETVDDLERAAEAGEIREVPGFGAKTEENILENVAFAREAGLRALLGRARPVADDVLAWLRSTAAVERCEVAGSIRRWRPTIGDVDVLVASEDPEAAVAAFTDADRVDDVVEAGTSKAAVRAGGLRVDLRVVAPDQFGSALQYFTGSKGHNVTLRTYALERAVSLNEYGAFDVSDVDHGGDPEDGDADTEGERIAGDTEESMYEVLDLPWIPPELREDRGEVEAAKAGELPDLVETGAIRGDLHVHTDWSDGSNTIAEMAAGAAEFGHDYLCVADHATGPGVVGGVGLSDDEIREQIGAVEDAAADAPVELLTGVEANVDADGGISVGDDVLAELDLVVASPHSGLGRTDDATDRLVAAVDHPEVDVLGHPTGRLLNRRSGLTVDAAELGAAAAEAGVALEVNANPSRLDLDGAAVKAAIEEGAPIAVNTDAHRPGEFANLRYGVHTARRGWAERGDVINARPVAGLREFLD